MNLEKNTPEISMKKQKQKFLGLSPSERARLVSHRDYVGGNDCESWYGIGKLQYHFLVNQGLRHNHRFLDIACGALRLGQFLIPYLDSKNYYGIEGEKSLVDRGLEYEFFHNILVEKKPIFSYNYNFDFSFIDDYDFAIAQSLFTHLTLEDIEKCFRNLALVSKPSSKFYFTFFEGSDKNNPKTSSHAQLGWKYSFSQLEQQAIPHGWRLTYIGNWFHPRGQMMVLSEIG